MGIILIKLIAPLALSVVQTKNDGIVHSVYSKTINLKFGEQIISLHPNSCCITPFSALVECSPREFSKLAVTPGECAGTDGASVFFGDSSFLLGSDFGVYEPELLPEKCVVLDREQLASVLKAILNERGVDASCPLFYGVELPKTPFELSERLCEGFVGKLVGLGPGLTPSGDDFLVGLLAALGIRSCAGLRRILSDEIEKCLARTVDISAQFLNSAIHNCFSQAVQNVFYSESAEQAAERIRELLALGHSSGADTARGIYYGLCLA